DRRRPPKGCSPLTSVRRDRIRPRAARWGRSEPWRLQGAAVAAAVEQDVLPGDEARLGPAQPGAGLAELGRVAEALGRVLRLSLRGHLVEGSAATLGDRLDVALQPVGRERAGEQSVDGHVVLHGLTRQTGHEAGEAGAGAV